MCANYIPAQAEQLRQYFGVTRVPADFKPETYPGYLAPIIRLAEDGSGALECINACFGMVPSWAELKLARHTYNARTETVTVKPSFRHAYARHQFCIIPAASFFEPNYESGKPVRWKLSQLNDEPMGLAGIWEWRPHGGPDDKPLFSFSMLTINADAHPLMKRFHRPEDEKRMVVVLKPDQYQAWLQSTANTAPNFWLPCPADLLKAEAAPRQTKLQTKPILIKAIAHRRTEPLWLSPEEE